MLVSGDVLQHRYRIMRPLGSGGMARVYLAIDTRLGERRVALKEMDPSNLAPDDRVWAIPAFRREAEVLARLNHPGIARVSDFFEENALFYLVMEFVEGETLAAALQRAPHGFAEGQVLVWAGQLAEVLDYLHGRTPPIIFRDLKPNNVMVQPDGALKLIDFGIARLFKPGQTVDTLSLGTPGYAAPEQYGRGQTDARSDVYSLGVLLHQLLTGYDPATTPMRLPPVQQLNPAVSPRVAQALAQALQVKPEQRFRSMRALANALGAPATGPGTPPPAPPDPTRPLPSGWVQRWSGLPPALRVALPLLLVVAVAFLAWFRFGRAASDGNGVGPATPAGGDGGTAVRGAVTATPTGATRATVTVIAETATGEVIEVVAAATPTPMATVAVPSSPPTWTPLPAATWTPDLLPTWTPYPSPTAVPTWTATATAPVPCAYEAYDPFAALYAANEARLGCPADGGRDGLWSAQEDFQYGRMLWRSDSDLIYVFYDGGTWAAYRDTWREGDPDYTCGVPMSPPTPRRGFGKVWCTYHAVSNGLGNATEGEWGSESSVQDFVKGSIWRIPDGAILVIFDDGTWK